METGLSHSGSQARGWPMLCQVTHLGLGWLSAVRWLCEANTQPALMACAVHPRRGRPVMVSMVSTPHTGLSMPVLIGGVAQRGCVIGIGPRLDTLAAQSTRRS